MDKMIGIDLGTTNSCVAVMEGGVPRVIPNQEGERTTPSVVGFTANGERLVGSIAKRQALTNPKNTVFAVKRLIGKEFDSPESEEARKFLPLELVNALHGDVHIQIEDKVYSPLEISSFVLQKLKAAAEDYLGEAVYEAIITVPTHFNLTQRRAMKDAGHLAGLRVSRVISGSTAAALTYGFENPTASGQFVAVCDLGGGTFDVTILELADGLLQVRAISGDSYLGGEDFDQRIIEWLVVGFQRERGIDFRQDRTALQRLKEAAERAKCELSTVQETEIVLPFISADASGPKHLNAGLTRQKYEELTDELAERTSEPCRRCLADAGLRPEQIDEVLLVGGQTRSLNVRRAIHKVFGRPMKRAADDGVVARGAAIQTGIIQGEVKDLVFLDVTPHTLGIETKDGTFTTLIERNSTIPTRKSRVFTTVADNQTRVEIHVLEGESDMAAHNKSLATLEVSDLKPVSAGKAQIEVTFELGINDELSVSAVDQASGVHEGVVVRRAQASERTGIRADRPTDEVRGLVLSPESHVRATEPEVAGAIIDMRARSLDSKEVIVRQLGGLVTNTLRAVQALEGRLTPSETEQILPAIERARAALAGGGLDELQAGLVELERAARLIGQAMLRP